MNNVTVWNKEEGLKELKELYLTEYNNLSEIIEDINTTFNNLCSIEYNNNNTLTVNVCKHTFIVEYSLFGFRYVESACIENVSCVR